jgi:adenosylcobinamide-GDP ribazoletransferase
VGGGLTSALTRAWRDVLDALAFFTRLPVRGLGALELNRIAWAVPVAGVGVALIGILVLAICRLFGLPVLFSAALATAAMVAATGALHEDGLADVADGFGGGATRERKLEIMRDSQIGTFGAIAVSFALILRVAALGATLGWGFGVASGALAAVAALSRAGALAPLAMLAPARLDGAGAAAGRLEPPAFAAACGVAFAIAVAAGLSAFGTGRALRAAVGAAVCASGMVALARRQIGGQTGDVAGAAQQWAEVGAWAGLLIGQSAA